MSKRDEIAQRVLGKLVNRDAPAAGAVTAPAQRRPMNTFIGQLGEQVAQGYAARVEELERERESGLVLLRLDPKTIGLTEFANRDVRGLGASDENFAALKESVRANGQDTPVRVRPAAPGSAKLYELVEGHRRHAACLALDKETVGGFRILARLDSAARDTKNLVLKMYRENAERMDLSPFEYGRMFQSWLTAKVFQRQGELAKAVGLVDSSVTKYLQVAELPAEVIAAFGDPRAISLRWVADLNRALKRDGSAVRSAARAIAGRNPHPAADATYRELAAFGVEPSKTSGSSREETVKIKGKVAFSLTRRSGRVTVKFGKTVDRQFQQEVGDAIKEAAERLLSKRLGGK